MTLATPGKDEGTILEAMAEMLPALASFSHKMADTLSQRQRRRYRSSSEGEYQETHLATRESFGNCRRT